MRFHFWRCVIGFSFLLVPLTVGATPVRKVLRPYGFQEVRPPSTYFSPGTLVRRIGAASVPVCTAEESLGSGFQATESQSLDVQLTNKLAASAKAELPEIEQVKAEFGSSVVKEVSVTMANVKLYMVSDAAVQSRLSLRDPNCEAVVKGLIAQGTSVWMVQGVLSGDITYAVKFEETVEATAKVSVTDALSAQLGAQFSSSGDQRVAGTALNFGVIGSRRLGYLGTVPDSDLPKKAGNSDVERCIAGDVGACDDSDDTLLAPPG